MEQIPVATPSLSFAAWVAPHQDLVMRVVARLARPADRDDAYQRTLIAAWSHRDRYDPAHGELRSWLAAIAANEARRTWRARRPERLPAEVLDTVADVHIVVNDVARDVDLERCIARLSDAQRTAVLLYYFVDLSVAECAAAMSRTESSVKVLLHKARNRLARMWNDDGDD